MEQLLGEMLQIPLSLWVEHRVHKPGALFWRRPPPPQKKRVLRFMGSGAFLGLLLQEMVCFCWGDCGMAPPISLPPHLHTILLLKIMSTAWELEGRVKGHHRWSYNDQKGFLFYKKQTVAIFLKKLGYKIVLPLYPKEQYSKYVYLSCTTHWYMKKGQFVGLLVESSSSLFQQQNRREHIGFTSKIRKKYIFTNQSFLATVDKYYTERINYCR